MISLKSQMMNFSFRIDVSEKNVSKNPGGKIIKNQMGANCNKKYFDEREKSLYASMNLPHCCSPIVYI